jgi:hypothetical protein
VCSSDLPDRKRVRENSTEQVSAPDAYQFNVDLLSLAPQYGQDVWYSENCVLHLGQ